MKRFTAYIRHSVHTVRTMCKVQYNMFSFPKKVLMMILSVILVVVGVANIQSFVGLLMTMFGCFAFTSLDMPARSKADDVIGALKGEYPFNQYEFYDKYFKFLAQNHDIINYDRLIGLVEDELYCYLFISADGCYMIEKSSLAGELKEFMAFMSSATGKRWQQPPKLSTFNLKTIIAMLRGDYSMKKQRRK